jgi:cutinase
LVVSLLYSQGAALAAAAIRDVDASIRDKIVGTALFGYTKNQQNNGQVINYPGDRLAVYCKEGDLVCEGTLIVAPPHLDYGDEAGVQAPGFLAGKINV